MNNFSQYQNSVDFLESLINIPRAHWETVKDKRILLKRTKILLRYLKNPEKKLKIIHIGGTSGKGSVANFIQNQLCKNGFKTGIYTSPHPTTTIERYKINDLYISPKDFACLIDELKPVLQEIYLKEDLLPSYFDIQVALALKWFAEQKCDYVVLEVGCGGTYDSTNAVSPIVSVITNIGKDHMEFLGNTLPKIAKEKAGIIKNKVPLFTAESRPRLLQIFKTFCSEKKSPIKIINTKEYRIKRMFPHLEFEYKGESYISAQTGESQVQNIILAIEVLKHLKMKIFSKFDAILPCRLEIIQKNPLTIIDGAHNGAKIQNLVSLLKFLPSKKKHLILGIADDKQKRDILKPLAKNFDNFYLTRFSLSSRKATDMKELAKHIKKINSSAKIEIFLDAQDALATVLAKAGKSDAIIITGSFFLAGELRTHWINENQILTTRNSFAR